MSFSENPCITVFFDSHLLPLLQWCAGKELLKPCRHMVINPGFAETKGTRWQRFGNAGAPGELQHQKGGNICKRVVQCGSDGHLKMAGKPQLPKQLPSTTAMFYHRVVSMSPIKKPVVCQSNCANKGQVNTKPTNCILVKPTTWQHDNLAMHDFSTPTPSSNWKHFVMPVYILPGSDFTRGKHRATRGNGAPIKDHFLSLYKSMFDESAKQSPVA